MLSYIKPQMKVIDIELEQSILTASAATEPNFDLYEYEEGLDQM